MAVTINASTSAGLVMTSDLSGVLTLQQNGVSLPNGGVAPAFSAYASSAQTIATATWTKITFDTEEFDTNNNFASSRFTPTVAGYYQVSSNCEWSTGSLTTGVGAFAIYKNGSPFKRGNQFNLVSSGNVGYGISLLVYCNGTTDYLEIYMYQASGANLGSVNSDNGNAVWFTGSLVRGA